MLKTKKILQRVCHKKKFNMFSGSRIRLEWIAKEKGGGNFEDGQLRSLAAIKPEERCNAIH